MPWEKWMPKPSAKLCQYLAALKPRKNQPPLGPMEKRVDVLEKRFLKYTKKAKSGCLEWIGNTLPQGYGSSGVGHKILRTHRLAWMLYRGEIPKGMFVCHKCDNPPCVNPDHLFLGTAKDNADDMIAKGRSLKGSSCSFSRLDENKVLEIRATKRYWGSVLHMARKFNVAPETIQSVLKGQSWKHVDTKKEYGK